jgi:pimeloyl-ACP methyl ester carboxylesterase
MTNENTLVTQRMTIRGYEVDVHMNHASKDKKAIVLVHGIGVSGRYFFPLASELIRNYHVVIIDLPGYGKTSKPKDVLSIAELAMIVTGVSHQLVLHKPIILGHSMGCQIVAHAVKQESKLYSKMILIAPTVNANERTLLMQALRLTQDIFFEPIRAGVIIFTDYMRMGLHRYLVTCRYMLNDRIEETLADCKPPILLVRGQNDVIVPSTWIQELHHLTPSLVCEIADAPHAVQLKSPEFLADICHDFIES